MLKSIRTAVTAAVAAVTLIGIAGNALADETKWQKDHPRREQVNNRLARQSKRINTERREGEITKAQAHKLHAEDRAIRLPLTQVGLADTLGLTSVHVNRILQGFRRDNLIALAHHRLTLLDGGRLQKIAGLNQDYLHLDGATAEVRSYIDALERNRREIC